MHSWVCSQEKCIPVFTKTHVLKWLQQYSLQQTKLEAIPTPVNRRMNETGLHQMNETGLHQNTCPEMVTAAQFATDKTRSYPNTGQQENE